MVSRGDMRAGREMVRYFGREGEGDEIVRCTVYNWIRAVLEPMTAKNAAA